MTGTKPSTRIVELPVPWLRDHMHEALTIYGLAMGYDSAVVAGRYGYAVQHTERPGFRAVGAFAETPEGERLVRRRHARILSPTSAVCHSLAATLESASRPEIPH